MPKYSLQVNYAIFKKPTKQLKNFWTKLDKVVDRA